MGVCYYPEHWPENLWAEDLDRMLDTGISVIRIAEFAWNKIEPEEGRFEFGFFERFLDLCEEKKMKVIFGTPTATPPAWLTEKYPEVLNGTKDGVLYRHGGRRHYNYNSPVYQEFCARIVEKEAEHYGKHPAIVGWQIDNELNCETCEFYSEADSAAFRVFLKEKYGTLERLNDAWGTIFWNQTYTDWEEIYVPRTVLNNGINPHQHLDYFRFLSDSTISFCGMQAEIIRKYKKPEDYITTNGIFWNVDNHRMEKDCLDVYTFDSYPSFAFGLDRDPRTADDLNDRKWTMRLNEVRSVCPHFGIMEQQSGANGWTTRMEGPAPRPGQLTLWAMQSVAQGADYISFFRWRTCTVGTEIYWHGILDYDNRDNRKLAEVQDFYRKLKRIDAVCGAENVVAFALIKDYDNEWDTEVDTWHRRVAEQSEKEIFIASELYHTPYDIVYLQEDSQVCDLSRYPAVIYPHPTIMDEKMARLLKEYVEQGGILVIGCRSGYKDRNGKCVMLPQPGLLQEITGSDVRDFTFVSPAEEAVWASGGGKKIEMPLFNDILEPLEGAEILAVYENSYYAEKAAVTENKLGKGKALHFGSTFSRNNLSWLFEYLGIKEPFAYLIDAPETLEVVLREKDGKQYLFVLNFQPEEVSFVLKKEMRLLYTGETLQGEQALPAYGTAVYEAL
ncbi:MAG: beta-galactosidase [Dorea sp.]|nr:beta-galactosidase [Dorea sp.]